ncbi:MAG: TolC family protein, partial [Candidatus Omnitrophica bacterium]|nr:TolC family protein [Candidatus Omnitrophota bacterium]
YSPPIESITQYIIDISQDIHSLLQETEESLVYNSRGELRLRLLLSPWGELKDVYISASSGNEDLDNICLQAVWLHQRYQPFPEDLGSEDQWIEVPIIFDTDVVAPSYGAKDYVVAAQDAATTSRGSVAAASYAASDVQEAVDIALENHMAAKIAEEEIELSMLKIREARRALYPSASLNYLETIGKTTGSTQDFTDKEYKLKFEYPLYYGWRLKYAVDQAVSNMKAQIHNYDKTLQDLRVEVETAFYSYLTAKIDRELQHSLLEKAGHIFDIAKKKFDLELSTRSEFLEVDSQLKQIGYQVASSENTLAMAKLTLEQAMNLEDFSHVEDLVNMDVLLQQGIGEFSLGNLANQDIRLEECMDLALNCRPELKVEEYTVEYNEYGRKIAKGKDQLKVDLTGSYGRSGGAYETESLVLGADWYVGVKVSKPFGGNTLSLTCTEEQTSEKHGQSSRTESVSEAVELGLLDNLESFSEKKSSEIALKKAKDKFEQTKGQILKEVNQAYLDYKKGLIQVETNYNKIAYEKEKLKITEAHAKLDIVGLPELLRAYMNLTDEESFYIEAIGSLYQALAKLNKATGYALFLDSENFMLANLK